MAKLLLQGITQRVRWVERPRKALEFIVERAIDSRDGLGQDINTCQDIPYTDKCKEGKEE